MTAHKSGDPTTLNRLYGRAKGKPLRAFQQSLVEDLLPQIAVPTEGPITAERLFGERVPAAFRNRLRRRRAYGAACRHAARPWLHRLPSRSSTASLQALAHVHGDAAKPGIPNVRIHHGDALEVLARIPDGALSFVYLLHPDPWPKARHAKRRMMNKGPVDLISAKLKPGGEFRFGTDHPVYLRWALMVMNGREDFQWLCDKPADFLKRPGGWPETRYEAKARKQGHEVWYFRFRRR
jgi:tRNA (guanine-N7-)-methyltransferase